MRILVAGGGGFIGSVLTPMLLERGHDAEVVDLFWFGNALPPRVPFSQRDLFDLTEEDLAGFDLVVFMAGLSNDPMAEYDPARNFIDNGALPSYLAFCAKKAGVKRFVYASSCSVYGFTVNEMYDEEAPVTCAYPYGISKLQGERGVLQLQDDSFSTIALRQGTVCGYSPRMRFDLIVNTMYKCAMSDRQITVNNPIIWRPIIDVRDTARAFVQAIESPMSVNGVFNVAIENFTVGEIAETVRAYVEKQLGERIRVTTKNIQDVRNYRVTSEKARRVLGFRPLHGVADMLESIHTHHANFGDFADDAYYNINTFRKIDDARRASLGL